MCEALLLHLALAFALAALHIAVRHSYSCRSAPVGGIRMRYVYWPKILEPLSYGTHSAFCGISCPNCPGGAQEQQEKLTAAHLERLRGASRGAVAAHFDTAFRCQPCGTIYFFQNGTGFPLVRLPPPRSFRESWLLFLRHAASSRARLFRSFS